MAERRKQQGNVTYIGKERRGKIADAVPLCGLYLYNDDVFTGINLPWEDGRLILWAPRGVKSGETLFSKKTINAMDTLLMEAMYILEAHVYTMEKEGEEFFTDKLGSPVDIDIEDFAVAVDKYRQLLGTAFKCFPEKPAKAKKKSRTKKEG